jgi:hypothetical protein
MTRVATQVCQPNVGPVEQGTTPVQRTQVVQRRPPPMRARQGLVHPSTAQPADTLLALHPRHQLAPRVTGTWTPRHHATL